MRLVRLALGAGFRLYSPATQTVNLSFRPLSTNGFHMIKRQLFVSLFIIAMVGTIAAWSKLRYVGQEGYDAPLRWKASEYPGLQEHGGSAG